MTKSSIDGSQKQEPTLTSIASKSVPDFDAMSIPRLDDRVTCLSETDGVQSVENDGEGYPDLPYRHKSRGRSIPKFRPRLVKRHERYPALQRHAVHGSLVQVSHDGERA